MSRAYETSDISTPRCREAWLQSLFLDLKPLSVIHPLVNNIASETQDYLHHQMVCVSYRIKPLKQPHVLSVSIEKHQENSTLDRREA